MKNSIGSNLQVTLFGESHGPFIGCVLDGLTPGIKIDEAFIRHQLSLRRPNGKISTARVEADDFQIVSGAFQGFTTGTPLCILIPNTAQHSKDYSKTASIARPGHADYTAECKYHGFQDYRGGGHFSGRITAALVAAAAIVIPALAQKGILIGTHIKSCAGIKDIDFADSNISAERNNTTNLTSGTISTTPLTSQIKSLNEKSFALLDDDAAEKMQAEIEKIAARGDSLGGVLETAITGLPAGLGEPWFDSFESLLSHAIFSIPAIKGIQFGAGFDMVNGLGSDFNDSFRTDGNKVYTLTNHNGGINGGITNGMPVIFRTAVKPTPSIYKEQQTIDFKKKQNTNLIIEGRHDPAIIHRARVVQDSLTALVLADLLLGRFGTDYFFDKNKSKESC